MRKLIKEDKVSDYIKKMIINNSAYSREQLGTNINELPDNMKKALHDGAPTIYEACSRNNQNLLAYFRLYFLSYFDISHGKGPLEYAIGLARIAIGEIGMFKGRNVDSSLSKLKVNVLFLHNSEDVQLKSRFNGNLNGLNYMELTSQLDGERREFNRKNRDVLSNMGGDASDYVVVPISSYKEASKYGQYTSWCVTHGENHFHAYTEGGRRFYFCLKKGFETVPKERGNGCPLDKYGLSMISVLVDSEGEPNYITTRWNHENDGENNENLRTAEQMQKITGINFYSTFKPYTLEELRAMGITPTYIAQELLDQGISPYKIFNYICDFFDGYAQVGLNNKTNFIDKSNKLLSPNQWFNYANRFYEGYAQIELNGKMNLIDTKGNLVSPNLWFDKVSGFVYYNYASFKLNDKWNFIDKKGHVLFPNLWLDDIHCFFKDYIIVELNHKFNFINRSGKLVSPNQWFDDVDDGTNMVFLNGEWYYIDDNGHLHSDITENLISISKSDIKNMVMECVTKIIKEKYKIS